MFLKGGRKLFSSSKYLLLLWSSETFEKDSLIFKLFLSIFSPTILLSLRLIRLNLGYGARFSLNWSYFWSPISSVLILLPQLDPGVLLYLDMLLLRKMLFLALITVGLLEVVCWIVLLHPLSKAWVAGGYILILWVSDFLMMRCSLKRSSRAFGCSN